MHKWVEFAEGMDRVITELKSYTFNVKEELILEESWLYSDQRYDTVRKMYLEGDIQFLYLDLADRTGRFSQIADWLSKKNLYVQTLYLSNILEWLKKAGKPTFDQGLDNIQQF